jgi:hypothetical protein
VLACFGRADPVAELCTKPATDDKNVGPSNCRRSSFDHEIAMLKLLNINGSIPQIGP